MVNYSCSNCQKIFKQKGHYEFHMNRKTPCKKDNTIERLVEEKVRELLLKSTPTCKHIKYVDLFAGIGGFRYGINAFQSTHPNYTFECIKTVDIKKDANSTYNLNFKEENPICDIRTIRDLPHFHLLCAGFPCQPFSSAGKKQGLSDETRGDLIYEVIRICKESTPDYIILENVSNIEKLDNGEILKRILLEFEAIGYNMSYKNINSTDVGLAQDRLRTFIFGFRNEVIKIDIAKPVCYQKVKDVIDYSDADSNIPTEFLNMLLDKPQESLHGISIKDKRGGADNLHSWDIDYHGKTTSTQRTLLNSIMRERRKKKWAIEKGIHWMDGMPLTYNEIKTFNNYPDLESDLEYLTTQGYLRLEHPKDLINGKRVYTEVSPKGYNICKGKLSFPISKILSPTGNCPTLTATDSCKLAVHTGITIRRLNKKELAQLCGFPGDIIIPKTVDMYDLFGNMVCPPVITAILTAMFDS